MRLTQQTRNAIRVLIHCARQESQVFRISEIAKACDITEFNAFKLIPILVQGQFLITIRGRYGGVKLAMEPADISVGAVVRATEQSFAEQEASSTKKATSKKAQPDENSELFQGMMAEAFETFLHTLDAHTIADFLTSNSLGDMLGDTAKKKHDLAEQDKASSSRPSARN